MRKWFALALSLLLIAADQLTKQWALRTLVPARRIPVIEGLFYFSYVENRGAAFGLFQGKAYILSIITSVVLLAVLVALLTNRIKGAFLTWATCIVLAGGIGNLIDRVIRGFVVDFIDFSAIFNFPVFNLADCCVVCASIAILVYAIACDRKQNKKNSGGDEA